MYYLNISINWSQILEAQSMYMKIRWSDTAKIIIKAVLGLSSVYYLACYI